MPRTARPTEKETFSGKLVDLIDPVLEDINFIDIATSLAFTVRFNGHCGSTYSVAQHSVLVASLMPTDIRHHGLLHDMPEAYVGDFTSPMKQAMRVKCPEFEEARAEIEDRFLVLIYQKAGFRMPTPEIEAEIKKADLTALAIEQRLVMHSPNIWNLGVERPEGVTLYVQTPEQAYFSFATAMEDAKIARILDRSYFKVAA